MSSNTETAALHEHSLRDALEKNRNETQMCEAYKNDLQMATRNLQCFQYRVRVDVMVPLGSHALMPGYLYHTNEVLIGKPSGIFIESTAGQALDVVQRRMKVADKRIKDLTVESEFFQNKLEYPQQMDLFSYEDQKEIIEEYDEEAEEQWRIAHRQKQKAAKLKEREERNNNFPDKEYEALMESLDELELMEELQEEFNSIVIPDPLDLSGQVEFKEKPRVSYLDSFAREPEEIKSSEDVGHVEVESLLTAMPSEEKEPQEKITRKKAIQFSEDLEKVKLIRKLDRPSTLITNYDPELTLQLKFKHSPVEYHPAINTSDSIRSPTDIYQRFAHCMKHWAAPSTPEGQPKSILKKTSHVIPVNRRAELVSAGEDPQMQHRDHEEILPGINIYEQVVGNIVERNVKAVPSPERSKKAVNFNDDPKNAIQPITAENGKRVSRFKAMRS